MHERRFHTPIDPGKKSEHDVPTITFKDTVVLRLLTMHGEDAIPTNPIQFLSEWNNHVAHNPVVYSWDREQIIEAITALERAGQFRRKDRERGGEVLSQAQEIFRFVLVKLRKALAHHDAKTQAAEQSEVAPLPPSADDVRGMHPVVNDTDDLLATVGEGETGRESYDLLKQIGQVAGRDVSRFDLPPIEYVNLDQGKHITAQHLKQWYALGEVRPGQPWKVPGDVIIGIFISIPSSHPQHPEPITVYHRFTDAERQAVLLSTQEKPSVVGRRVSQQEEQVLSRQEHRIPVRSDEVESGNKKAFAELISRRHLQLYFRNGRLHVEDISRNHGVYLVLPKTDKGTDQS